MNATDSAREAARRADGKFGTYARDEEDPANMPGMTAAAPRPGDKVTLPGIDATGDLEWDVTDADDRYPGRFNAYVGAHEGALMRITPGDSASYVAPGFQWTMSYGTHTVSGTAETLDAAARDAADSADFYASGEAEYEAMMADSEAADIY